MNSSHIVRVAAAAVLWAAAVLLAATAAGCASASGSPDPERRFYEGRCGVCHVPFRRTDFPPDRWPGIVAQFAPRAGLTTLQRERILRYLTATEAVAAPR